MDLWNGTGRTLKPIFLQLKVFSEQLPFAKGAAAKCCETINNSTSLAQTDSKETFLSDMKWNPKCPFWISSRQTAIRYWHLELTLSTSRAGQARQRFQNCDIIILTPDSALVTVTRIRLCLLHCLSLVSGSCERLGSVLLSWAEWTGVASEHWTLSSTRGH